MRKKILFGFIATISVLAGFFITNFTSQKANVSAAEDLVLLFVSGIFSPIPENTGAGTFYGSFTVYSGQDLSDVTFSLCDDPTGIYNSDLYSLEGRNLMITKNPDYETLKAKELWESLTPNTTPLISCVHATDGIVETDFISGYAHVSNVNEAPTISGIPPTNATVGESYSFTPTATDEDGDELTFSAPTLPDWLSLDPITGVLSGTPTSGGSFSPITLAVSDGEFTTELEPFNILANTPPQFVSTPTPTTLTAEKGTEYSYTVSATDADDDTLTFSAPTLPDWLSFDPVTRTLSGTPTEYHIDQDFDVEIAVSDGKITVTQSFSIRVNNREEQPEIPAPNTDKPQDNQTTSPRTGQTTKNSPTSQQNRLIFAILCGSLVIIYGLNLTRRHFTKK